MVAGNNEDEVPSYTELVSYCIHLGAHTCRTAGQYTQRERRHCGVWLLGRKMSGKEGMGIEVKFGDKRRREKEKKGRKEK